MSNLSQEVASVADIAQGCSEPPVYFSSLGKAPWGSSGTQGGAPCLAHWLTLLITTSDGVKMRTLSPGLAGLLWVSSVTRGAWERDGDWKPSCWADVFQEHCWFLWSQLQDGNIKAGCDYQERD